MLPPDHFQDENVASDYDDCILTNACGALSVSWRTSSKMDSPKLYKHLLWYLFEAMWRALLSNSEY